MLVVYNSERKAGSLNVIFDKIDHFGKTWSYFGVNKIVLLEQIETHDFCLEHKFQFKMNIVLPWKRHSFTRSEGKYYKVLANEYLHSDTGAMFVDRICVSRPSLFPKQNQAVEYNWTHIDIQNKYKVKV